MKQGFTLIEVLVASVLMGMLVTILTMVFNSSSIAWRTGKAGIRGLNDTRREIALYGRITDDALPRVKSADASKVALTVSAWSFKDNKEGQDALRSRAFVLSSGGDSKTSNGEKSRVKLLETEFKTVLTTKNESQRRAWDTVSVQGIQKGDNQKSYTVGVTSAGPNGVFGDDDDITTWPEDI